MPKLEPIDTKVICIMAKFSVANKLAIRIAEMVKMSTAFGLDQIAVEWARTNPLNRSSVFMWKENAKNKENLTTNNSESMVESIFSKNSCLMEDKDLNKKEQMILRKKLAHASKNLEVTNQEVKTLHINLDYVKNQFFTIKETWERIDLILSD